MGPPPEDGGSLTAPGVVMPRGSEVALEESPTVA